MRGWPFLAVAGACAVLVAAPGLAYAGSPVWSVNSTGDASDASPSDAMCVTATPGQCTLRAALEQSAANGNTSTDIITFTSGPGGVQGQTITAAGDLDVPSNTQVSGCSPAPTPTAPCVGVTGNPASSALHVVGANSSVEGLALNGAFGGINIDGQGTRMTNCWLGLTLAGNATGNQLGAVIAGANTVIGGTQAHERNVFANNSVGIQIVDAENVTILGNYFGTNNVGTDADIPPPGGTGTLRNGDNVEIVQSVDTQDVSGTVIGATVAEPFASSPQCDGGCNLIARAAPQGLETGIGVDLHGDDSGPFELENTRNTTIKGNFFGLDVGGTLNYANQASAIRANGAENTVIGGPSPGDRNYIAGGENAITHTGGLGETLTVRNNFLGLNSEGTAAMPSLFALILATNTGAAPFDIRDNRFGAGGTTQVGVNVAAAGGASISGNTFGLGTGGQDLGFPNSAVRIVGSNVSVTGNTVGHGGAGVLVEGGDQNTLTGNTIGVGPGGSHAGTSGAGVAIRDRSALTDPAIGNTVGGDDAASENVISNSGTDAIEISGTPGALPQGNTVKRNRGTGNAGLFVDLGTDGFGDSTGANGGALPPTITSVTPTGASGTAGAGHTVRVFRAGGTAGSIEGFVGQAVADAGGAWSVTYAAPLAEGQLVTAAATDAAGNSSEYAPAVATAGPPAQPEGQGGGGEVGGGSATTPVVDTSRPNVAVAMRPSAFPAATRGDSIGSAGRRTGTTVTYRLSEPARAAFTVERRTVGRRVGRRCRRATRSNRSRRKCTLYVRVRGGFAHSGAAGTNRFHFTGRMNRRALKPARYRLVAGATDSAGNRSATKRRPFRIVR